MRDPVYAMKSYGGVNGDFSTTWCTRNCARPRSISTATWLIPSIHNWVQMQAVSSPCTAPRFVGLALLSAGVGVQWNECGSTYVYYNWTATITPATTSTADCRPVSEKSVPQPSLAMRVDKGNSSRNSMTQDHKGLKDVYETIHSDNCYSPAVILVRCVRAIEKP